MCHMYIPCFCSSIGSVSNVFFSLKKPQSPCISFTSYGVLFFGSNTGFGRGYFDIPTAN